MNAGANRRTLWRLSALGLVMLGLSFAAVPLHDLFCRVTGYGGTTSVADSAPADASCVDTQVDGKQDHKVELKGSSDPENAKQKHAAHADFGDRVV